MQRTSNLVALKRYRICLYAAIDRGVLKPKDFAHDGLELTAFASDYLRTLPAMWGMLSMRVEGVLGRRNMPAAWEANCRYEGAQGKRFCVRLFLMQNIFAYCSRSFAFEFVQRPRTLRMRVRGRYGRGTCRSLWTLTFDLTWYKIILIWLSFAQEQSRCSPHAPREYPLIARFYCSLV